MEDADIKILMKWNNFQADLATELYSMLLKGEMVDVTLVAKEKFIKAHKIILSVCNPFFKDLFKDNPCKHQTVILEGVGHQEISNILEFMYRGEACVRLEEMKEFLRLGAALKVKGFAGDKFIQEEYQAQKKPVTPLKKKRIVEQTVLEPDDDPGDSDYAISTKSAHNTPFVEPKSKRRRASSLTYATVEKSDAHEEDVGFLEEPLQELKTERADSIFDDPTQDMTDMETSTELVAVQRAPASPIWNYFKRYPKQKLAVCKACGRAVRRRELHLVLSHPNQCNLFLRDMEENNRLLSSLLHSLITN